MRLRGSKEQARDLRRSMSLPEVILWQELRKKPNGVRFRRQHPAGEYVLDFFCATANLAIEVDGEAHCRGDRAKRDEIRDRWLKERGVRTLRIRATEVLNNVDGVLVAISMALDGK